MVVPSNIGMRLCQVKMKTTIRLRLSAGHSLSKDGPLTDSDEYQDPTSRMQDDASQCKVVRANAS